MREFFKCLADLIDTSDSKASIAKIVFLKIFLYVTPIFCILGYTNGFIFNRVGTVKGDIIEKYVYTWDNKPAVEYTYTLIYDNMPVKMEKTVSHMYTLPLKHNDKYIIDQLKNNKAVYALSDRKEILLILLTAIVSFIIIMFIMGLIIDYEYNNADSIIEKVILYNPIYPVLAIYIIKQLKQLKKHTNYNITSI